MEDKNISELIEQYRKKYFEVYNKNFTGNIQNIMGNIVFNESTSQLYHPDDFQKLIDGLSGHKYVSKYYVVKLPTGTIIVSFICKNNGAFFHRFNDSTFLITESEEEFDSYLPDDIITIHNTFLDQTDFNGIYIISHTIEENIIKVIYTPYHTEWIVNKEIIEQ